MLYSTEAAAGSRRVPDVLADQRGAVRGPIAAAMAGRASASAARAGRPRERAPLPAGYGSGHAPRAPPARPCPDSPTDRKMLGRLASAQRSAITCSWQTIVMPTMLAIR
jgi:hypothetical protein